MTNFSDKLKEELKVQGLKYISASSIKHNRKTALIFNLVKDNFLPASYASIEKNDVWKARTLKVHTNVPNALEMQSSNSSDALLMNIFCHPKITTWKGVQDLLGVPSISNIQFGVNPSNLLKNGKPEETPTEIDLLLNDEIYCEAKLTEKDFTQVAKDKMETYDDFIEVFDVHSLPQTDNQYDNFQLIRNVLAANSDGKRFILICDARRPDLIRHFYDVAICIKNIELRKRCSFICWQDLAQKCGIELIAFLLGKYGIQ